MAAHLSNGASNGVNGASNSGHTLKDLPKSDVFTANLPADPEYPTPAQSHKTPRQELGPRMVRNAMYTFVRPDPPEQSELVGVSPRAMKDLNIKSGEEETQDFKDMVAGKRIVTWDEGKEDGIYPWAQCYGGWQFGNWAGQLGDGRAISLFETTNAETQTRYELQLKGAGKTPYSRFADGKAVVRSSLREYICSEALNALNIPTTRALSLTILPEARVVRERIEPGAIVCRFAQTWLRCGSFDLIRTRGDRDLMRKLATYVAEHVYGGWEKLPARIDADSIDDSTAGVHNPARDVAKEKCEGASEVEENRFARLYREICRRNALCVAAWQAYGFTNGVLNTDNTSIIGLSIDFGPFAFLDNFDPSYTPNHDDHALRYCYRNQPTIIWWNLVRLGEDLGELLGSGGRADDAEFVEKGIKEEYAPTLIKRAESVIDRAGEEYRAVFMGEYKRLMTARLGLKSQQEADFKELFSELLDSLEALELDFHHFFRRLSSLRVADINSEEARKQVSSRFFHAEGGETGLAHNEDGARERIGAWLGRWRERVVQDWGENKDEEREKAMKAVNPNFVARGWLLDELIERVEKKGEREVLKDAMKMACNPFEDTWGTADEERWCADPPKFGRAMQCSCSS